MNQCPVCDGSDFIPLYALEALPVFQNIVYESAQEAVDALMVPINLQECLFCGFVHNPLFDPSLLVYDKRYQNEQGLSPAFERHLDQTIQSFLEKGYKDKSVTEIGCGKGLFLEKMKRQGFQNIKGFDPAYEGDSPYISVSYFDENSEIEKADLIIIRHVLEHIEDPIAFLQMVAKANNYHGDIFIEAPNFDWIRRSKAFWMVFPEQCSYFSLVSMKNIFKEGDVFPVFGDQYLNVYSPLRFLNNIDIDWRNFSAKGIVQDATLELNQNIEKVRQLFERYSDREIIIWGGSARGVILVSILDKDRQKVHCLIDINEKKQGKFIAGTGHAIHSPQYLKELDKDKIVVFVANGNYLNEIRQMIDDPKIELVEIN